MTFSHNMCNLFQESCDHPQSIVIIKKIKESSEGSEVNHNELFPAVIVITSFFKTNISKIDFIVYLKFCLF